MRVGVAVGLTCVGAGGDVAVSVGTGVLVGAGGLVGVGVLVGTGVLVGPVVGVGVAAAVGENVGVAVGTIVKVGVGVRVGTVWYSWLCGDVAQVLGPMVRKDAASNSTTARDTYRAPELCRCPLGFC